MRAIIYLAIIPLDYTFADAEVFETPEKARQWIKDEADRGVDITYAMLRKVEL